jgi:hypothetical protein
MGSAFHHLLCGRDSTKPAVYAANHGKRSLREMNGATEGIEDFWGVYAMHEGGETGVRKADLDKFDSQP